MRLSLQVVAILLVSATSLASDGPTLVDHVTVYRETGRFAGWPANNGIWNWGDEIVVGFTLGYHREKGGGHPIDGDRPSGPMLARSLDGGKTWSIETPNYLTPDGQFPDAQAPVGGIDFTHPDFALMFKMQGSKEGYSSYVYSQDRCRTWSGPYQIPDFGRKGIFARTDYIVDGKHEMTACMTAAEDEGGEGWPFACRTTDGGKTWEFVGWIGAQPEPEGYSIMPSTLRIDDDTLFSVIRRRGGPEGDRKYWIESYLSPDNGKNWYQTHEVWRENHGNPPHLIELSDGRWVLTYGYRTEPYGIRGRISWDKGKTWGDEIILRDDAAGWDLGYPRSVQRADGAVVTTYYYNDSAQVERYIGATIWHPGE